MRLEEKSTIPAVPAQLAYLASLQESAFREGIALNGLEELRLRQSTASRPFPVTPPGVSIRTARS